MGGHKIFVSYKFNDSSVYQKINHKLFEGREEGDIIVRDYVNVLQEYFEGHSEHIYKGEDDNTPLGDKSEDWIWSELKDSIFDSTLTIVLISPNMKENGRDRDQWIPWEISYSLSNETRKDSNGKPVRSNTNAMLAIVLPDRSGKYDYYFENKNCCTSGCRLNKTNILFNILKKNTFNQKDRYVEKRICDDKSNIYNGMYHSFIHFYKWCEIDSKEKIEEAIRLAYDILSKKEQYDISYEID